MNAILGWWFYDLNSFTVYRKTKVVNITMPAVTMQRVLKLHGEPLALRDYLLVETKAPGEGKLYSETDFLQTLENFVGKKKNVYAIIQYGLKVKFYKWEEGEATAMSEKLHLVRDVDEVMVLLERVRSNPLPIVDTGSDITHDF